MDNLRALIGQAQKKIHGRTYTTSEVLTLAPKKSAAKKYQMQFAKLKAEVEKRVNGRSFTTNEITLELRKFALLV